MALDDRENRFDTVKRYNGTNLKTWTWSVQNVVNQIMNGRTNNTDEVTLTANSDTTTVTMAHGRLGQNTVILFTPTTANAATELASGGMYVSGRSVSNRFDTNSTFTITHSNSGLTDKTFKYVLIG